MRSLLLGILAVRAIELNNEESLRKAVSLNPQDPDARVKLVRWHLQWGELRKATAVLKEAVTQDPSNAWSFKQMLGDLSLQYSQDERGAAEHYRESLKLNPSDRHSLLQYGMLRIWQGNRDEATKLFEEAAHNKMLSDIRQRPLEISRDASRPFSKKPWHEPAEYSSLKGAVEKLADSATNITKEYLKWAKTRAKDSEVDRTGVGAPYATGKWRHFWIHKPQFERGHWKGACSYKTPRTCELLKGMNETGRAGEKLVVLQADFDVLEPGGIIRPHCHTTDRETYLMLPLLLPRLGPNQTSSLSVGGEVHPWSEGEAAFYDASFEHEEQLPLLVDALDSTEHDYAAELRDYYTQHGMPDKVKDIPDILAKWHGKEEKMMRKVHEKYHSGWKGERVALRLLLRSSVFNSARVSDEL